jgi:hypothetical protein
MFAYKTYLHKLILQHHYWSFRRSEQVVVIFFVVQILQISFISQDTLILYFTEPPVWFGIFYPALFLQLRTIKPLK